MGEDVKKIGETLLGVETVQKIEEYLDLLRENDSICNFSVKIPLPENRDDRVLIHKFVRENLPFMES